MSGTLYVITGYRGVGKSTLVDEITKADSTIKRVVQYTTRPKHVSETNGIEYHFIDNPSFLTKIEKGEFLEYTIDHTYEDTVVYYGTEKKEVTQALEQGIDLIIELNHDSAIRVINELPECSSVFISSESLPALESLLKKGKDNAETIETKINAARMLADEQAYRYYKYSIINREGEIEIALGLLKSIIETNRLLVSNKLALSDPNDMCEKAIKLAQKGKFHEAIFIFNKVLDIEPNNIIALKNKGWVLEKIHEFYNAIECFNQVLRIGYCDADLLNNKADALYNMGCPKEAFSCIESALKINPEHLPTLNNKGWFYIESYDYDKALDIFNFILTIKSDFIPALNNKAFILFIKGEYQDSLAILKLINPQPSNNIYDDTFYRCALVVKGLVDLAIHNYPESAEEFKKAIDFKESIPDAIPYQIRCINNRKGRGLEKLGYHKQAVECYELILKYYPNYVIALQGNIKSLKEEVRPLPTYKETITREVERSQFTPSFTSKISLKHKTEKESKIHSLCMAAKENNIEELRKIINEGIDVNMPLNKGLTALHYACKAGSIEAVLFLEKNGGNIELTSTEGETPISYLKGSTLDKYKEDKALEDDWVVLSMDFPL